MSFQLHYMMTKSQLAASAKTPRTFSRGLPTTKRASVASLVIFYHRDSPHTTSRAVVTVNITSILQGPEVTIAGSRGGQDLPIDPTTNIENVDLKVYHSNSKGEHTTTTECGAQVESLNQPLAA